MHQPTPGKPTEPAPSDDKEIAFYSALVSAWIDTKMERDKTIVTLSAAAIGLLVTLLSTVGPRPPWTLWLYIGACVGFLMSLITCVVVFDKNSLLVEDLVQGRTPESKSLKRLDRLSLGSFAAGVIFIVSIGVVSAVLSQLPE